MEANAGFGPPHYNAMGALMVGTDFGNALIDLYAGKTIPGCQSRSKILDRIVDFMN